MPVLWVGCLMFLGWSLGACVLALFTWRRHNWARYLLVASAGAALVASTFAFPVGIAHQIACAVTIGALFSGRLACLVRRSDGRTPASPRPAQPRRLAAPRLQPPGHRRPPQRPEGKPPVW